MNKWGIMLVNLGTPDDTSVTSVRRYLKEFLSDPRVIDIPALIRFLLVNLIIVRFRGPKSAKAYRKIWTDRGSPLLFHGQDLAAKLNEVYQGKVQVKLAMRYQNPSIANVLEEFRREEIDQIIVFPLFPQYSSAAGGSAVAKVYEEASKHWNVTNLYVIPPYYDHPAFINALKEVSLPELEAFAPDHTLFSYHGVPERHVKKSEEGRSGYCLQEKNCCDKISSVNRFCYRAHCVATTKAAAKAFGLKDSAFSYSFQSRLGKDPWLTPYTDETIENFPKKGIKKLAVLCPAFTADNLETIEEIGMEAKESFLENGGEAFKVIPCLNSSDVWASAIAEMVNQYITFKSS